ncbi:MAG TPA: hypothetical protein PLX97_01530, partial [Gemmatales bacterium]|nr:hypothetical protein [Gemmatales bacterium]
RKQLEKGVQQDPEARSSYPGTGLFSCIPVAIGYTCYWLRKRRRLLRLPTSLPAVPHATVPCLVSPPSVR